MFALLFVEGIPYSLADWLAKYPAMNTDILFPWNSEYIWLRNKEAVKFSDGVTCSHVLQMGINS